jgi:hypothetical protein
VSAAGGSNTLNAPVAPNQHNFTAYRGLAFDLTATSSRGYAYYDFVDIDNGPAAAPGRGATLPFPAGADPAGADPPCCGHLPGRVSGCSSSIRDR